MKNIVLIIAFSICMKAKSQVTKVDLQASGLTCSMCSNAINKALKTLEFVHKVDADLKNYTFEITFKETSALDFNKMKKKVEDAGFCVSSLVVSIYFNNQKVTSDQSVIVDGFTLLLVNNRSQSLNGLKKLRILDRGFIPPKEYKHMGTSLAVSDPNIYHVSL